MNRLINLLDYMQRFLVNFLKLKFRKSYKNLLRIQNSTKNYSEYDNPNKILNIKNISNEMIFI